MNTPKLRAAQAILKEGFTLNGTPAQREALMCVLTYLDDLIVAAENLHNSELAVQKEFHALVNWSEQSYALLQAQQGQTGNLYRDYKDFLEEYPLKIES